VQTLTVSVSIVCISLYTCLLIFQRQLKKGSPSIFEVVKWYEKTRPRVESSDSGSGMLHGFFFFFFAIYVIIVRYSMQNTSCTGYSVEHELYCSFV
jgi:hypothetical protein